MTILKNSIIYPMFSRASLAKNFLTVRDSLAAAYFVLLAGILLRTLFPLWNSAIPGGLEDTRIFLWNAWWVHHAITVLHTNPFHTSFLFFPFGCNLISHDFPFWMNLITFVGQSLGHSMVSSSNAWFFISWVLLGFCVYGLTKEITGVALPALAAGTMAMTHSYSYARLMQNWGQFNSWSIAFFLWTLIHARKTQKTSWFVIAGIALAWNAACHYYFLIYSGLIWMAVFYVDASPLQLRSVRKSSRLWLLIPAIFCALIALRIHWHPGVYSVGGHSVSMLSAQNPLFVMWIFMILWGLSFWRFELKKREDTSSFIRQHIALGVTALLCLSPLIIGTLHLILEGGYPKQTILWKTHLPGANLLSLVMPNPLHVLWGQTISHWFTSRGMNWQEQAASIGWICLGVVLWTKVWKDNSSARRWLYLAIAATIMAMGTHLHIAQYNLWCPLPFFGLRLLPIVGNVRVPERWMAVGAIAWSVVLALSLIRLAEIRRWPLRTVSLFATFLILLENWPAVPIQALPTISPVYEQLRTLPDGAVLPIPLYIGDSSIGVGNSTDAGFLFPWDHLWAQVIHQKPIVGGFVGRISRRLIDDYKADPFIRTILDLEENKMMSASPLSQDGDQALSTFRFRYVMVYPQCTQKAVLDYVLGSLPLELVTQTPTVQLYRITI